MSTSNLPAVIEAAAKGQGLVPADVNLMLPSETYGAVLGAFDKVSIEVIRIDPDPRAGDVFEPGKKGLFALGKVPLERIANALSIQWHPQTGIVESTEKKSRAKAIGIMKKPNGELIVQTDEKTIDLTVVEDEAREKAEKDAEGGKVVSWDGGRPNKAPWKNDAERAEWIEREVRKAVMQKRKFKDELALTGAKDRVIRAFIATKSTYTAEELQKPFAFPRVSLDTSKMLADPDMRHAALGLIGGATSTLFGPRDQIPGSPEKALPPPTDAAIDVTETAQGEVDPFDLDPDSGVMKIAEKPTRTDEIRESLIDWANHDDTDISKRAEAIISRDERNERILEASLEIIKGIASKTLAKEAIDLCFKALDAKTIDIEKLESIAEKAKAKRTAAEPQRKAS